MCYLGSWCSHCTPKASKRKVVFSGVVLLIDRVSGFYLGTRIATFRYGFPPWDNYIFCVAICLVRQCVLYRVMTFTSPYRTMARVGPEDFSNNQDVTTVLEHVKRLIFVVLNVKVYRVCNFLPKVVTTWSCICIETSECKDDRYHVGTNSVCHTMVLRFPCVDAKGNSCFVNCFVVVSIGDSEGRVNGQGQLTIPDSACVMFTYLFQTWKNVSCT